MDLRRVRFAVGKVWLETSPRRVPATKSRLEDIDRRLVCLGCAGWFCVVYTAVRMQARDLIPTKKGGIYALSRVGTRFATGNRLVHDDVLPEGDRG